MIKFDFKIFTFLKICEHALIDPDMPSRFLSGTGVNSGLRQPLQLKLPPQLPESSCGAGVVGQEPEWQHGGGPGDAAVEVHWAAHQPGSLLSKACSQS